MHLAEHPHRAQRIGEGNILGRGDDHGAVDRDLLREGQLRVTGSRRQVDNEKILSAPERVLEELPHRAHHHRTAPDHWRLFGEEKSHRDQLHAVFFDRVEVLAAGRARPLLAVPNIIGTDGP